MYGRQKTESAQFIVSMGKKAGNLPKQAIRAAPVPNKVQQKSRPLGRAAKLGMK